MNLPNLYLIARTTRKLLIRDRVFLLFFLFFLPLIFYFQIMEQSTLSSSPTPGAFTLASFIPHLNAYLFSVFQLLPLTFLATAFIGKEKRIDTIDAIYYRPASNVELVWGTSAGFIITFLTMGLVSLLLAAMIQLCASDAPFDILTYPFYLFTLILPTTVFSVGFSMFVQSVTRNRLLSLTILLVCLVLTIFHVQDHAQGLFDLPGITLPNAISGATGHPNLAEYLLQRGSWLFLGLGLIQLTVLNFRRLANVSGERLKRAGVAVSFLTLGLLFGFSLFTLNREKPLRRQTYAETYDKYTTHPKATLTRQDIEYRQQKSDLIVNGSLTVQNQTSRELPEILLYLNPALKVTSLQANGIDTPFERDHQVIRVHRSLVAGDTLNLRVSYEGGIDENVCYLDVPPTIVSNTRLNRNQNCRLGKKHVYLDDDFTLLIPEALWYPVTVPPVNPSSPHETVKNFAAYTLSVASPGARTVISQGQKTSRDGAVTFRCEHALPGITLCIGDYETWTVMIDSVACELNLFRGHSSILGNLAACDRAALSGVKAEVEYKTGKPYPFRRFALTEVPISFASYYRNESEGSEFVQPGLIFVPERFTGKINTGDPEIDLPRDLRAVLLANNDDPGFYSWFDTREAQLDMMQFFSNYQFKNNPYNASPLFFSHVAFFQSDDYPVLNTILKLVLRGYADPVKEVMPNWKAEVDAVDYLNGHSLKDALSDRELSQAVMHEIFVSKSREIMDDLDHDGIARDSVKAFIKALINAHPFEAIPFTRFDSAFARAFGRDWASILPSWYTRNEIPTYLVKDFSVKRVATPEETSSTTTLVQFSVFNDSDVDGIVNLRSVDMPYTISFTPIEWGSVQTPVNFSYRVKARTGREIAVLVRESQRFFMLNTNLSRNLPQRFFAACNTTTGIDDPLEYVRAVDKSKFQPASGEIVVDNEDDAFNIVQSSARSRFRDRFSEGTGPSVKYANVGAWTFMNDEWKTLVDTYTFGRTVRSAVFRLAGKGKSSVEWCTRLEKAGSYELFAYIPQVVYHHVMVDPDSKASIQTYTVSFQNGEKTIPVDTRNAEGWVSIGRFEGVPGESKISLSDRGNSQQIMVADAVKWVYLGK